MAKKTATRTVKDRQAILWTLQQRERRKRVQDMIAQGFPEDVADLTTPRGLCSRIIGRTA